MSKTLSAVSWKAVLTIVMSAHTPAIAQLDFLPFNIRISVEDDAGNLIAGAEVGVAAYLPESERTDGKRFAQQIKTSTSEAPLRFQGKCLHRIIVRVNRDGYYPAWVERRFDYNAQRYEPWDSLLRIVLHSRENPRPLYVKRVNWLPVPALESTIGFDLEKGDWAQPYGEGVYKDFLFRFSRNIGEGEVYSGTMDVAFAHSMDGIQSVSAVDEIQSTLLIGKEAPSGGYDQIFRRTIGVQRVAHGLERVDDPPRATLDMWDGMWFRVRSEVDSSTGELRRARYGKLDGFINFEVRYRDVEAKVAFTYYLSPDDSRSLEWNGESLVEHPDLQGVTKF